MKIKQLTCALLLAFGLTANAANTVTKVAQVSSEVTLAENVDYVITGTTPFAEGGKVNITNTDHAVLIIENIRPSNVLNKKLLNGHVYINGAQAVDGTNCQVRMYAHGTIVFPYAKDIKPLTVYPEPNYGGTAVSDFGLEHSGGFMNSLTEEKLNNQIRSFKLKRGYMVTFATGKSGWGYSRCFIADTEDLEFAELPAHLDARISSYRVFQWHDSQKKGLANDTRGILPEVLGVSSCYSFGPGENRLPDMECIPHRIGLPWPSPAECGSKTYSCHMKTNNEPGNEADHGIEPVEDILNSWQELMRTGMRLCSESSHDGSWAHLDEFISEIDKRGWRCDILDLHCYWASGFGNMEYYYNKYGKRPIWITEWVWGASWNNNGVFNTDRSFSTENQQKNLNEVKNILNTLNNSPYVERYYYWNSEADCSKLFRGEGEMSLAGEYYRDMNSGMAYRKEYEKIPNVVYSAPGNVTGEWVNQREGIYKLSWEDINFDLLNEIQVQRKMVDEEQYTLIATLQPIDQNTKIRTCTYQDTIAESGEYEYRIVNITAENKLMASPTFRVARSSVQYSDKIQYGEVSMVNFEENKVKYVKAFDATPAVFMGTLSNSNTDLSLSNLVTLSSENGFTYTPYLWVTSASAEFEDPESLPFMAIASGNHRFGNLDCEVGAVRSRMNRVDSVLFAHPFAEGVVPVVLTEINNPTNYKSPMVVKIWDVTNRGFKYKIMKEEQAESSSYQYNVNYLAVTPGVGVVDAATGLTIAAGRNEEAVSGIRPCANKFIHGDSTVNAVAPYVFACLQTNNYDAATLLRKSSNTTDETKTYTIGARFRRVVDSSCKTATDGTSLNTSVKDDLGWVLLYKDESAVNVESIDADTPAHFRPYVVGNSIYVDGGEPFDVYTLQGVRLSSPHALAAGVYVVRTSDAAAMVVVK